MRRVYVWILGIFNDNIYCKYMYNVETKIRVQIMLLTKKISE